jgi:glycosyltransferase involved in cell wall biosynthesis
LLTICQNSYNLIQFEYHMNIVYVSSPLEHNFGGGEKFIETLIRALPEDDHVFVGGSKPLYEVFQRLHKQAHLSHVGFEPVNGPNLLLSPLSFVLGFFHFVRFRKIWKQADVVVSPTSFTEVFFVLPWIHVLLRKKIVFIIQNNRCPKAIYANPLLPIMMWLWRRHPVVFMSQAQMEEWKQKGVWTEKCQVIYHGIELPGDVKVHTTSPIKIGFIARMHQEKGVETLLKSLSRVNLNGQKVEFLLGGDGPHLSQFKELAAGLRFPDGLELKWLGFVDKASEFYEQLDLVVFPSRRESFGLVVIEGWAHGLPVLCSNLPVFMELKAHQLCGADKELVFETGSEEDLARKLEVFLGRLDEYRNYTVRRQIQQTVVDYFNVQRMATEYRNVFVRG